jgi:hypothetical protein
MLRPPGSTTVSSDLIARLHRDVAKVAARTGVHPIAVLAGWADKLAQEPTPGRLDTLAALDQLRAAVDEMIGQELRRG